MQLLITHSWQLLTFSLYTLTISMIEDVRNSHSNSRFVGIRGLARYHSCHYWRYCISIVTYLIPLVYIRFSFERPCVLHALRDLTQYTWLHLCKFYYDIWKISYSLSFIEYMDPPQVWSIDPRLPTLNTLDTLDDVFSVYKTTSVYMVAWCRIGLLRHGLLITLTWKRKVQWLNHILIETEI